MHIGDDMKADCVASEHVTTEGNFFEDMAWPALHEQLLSLHCGATGDIATALYSRVVGLCLRDDKQPMSRRFIWHPVPTSLTPGGEMRHLATHPTRARRRVESMR
jgi:hypothetical protein